MLKGKKAQARGFTLWLSSNKDGGVKRSLEVRDAQVEANGMSGDESNGDIRSGMKT